MQNIPESIKNNPKFKTDAFVQIIYDDFDDCTYEIIQTFNNIQIKVIK